MRPDKSSVSVAVFSSYQTSLATWRRAGILARESRYLRLLSDRLGKTALVTYDRNDRQDPNSGGVDVIVGKPRSVPAALYSVFAPVLHWRLLRKTDVLRTNQLRGAWTAAIASLIHRKPLVVRTGYVWSQFEKAGKAGRLRSRLVIALERFAIRRASLVITASEADREALIGLHGIPGDKVKVVPNPIDTELFSPAQEDRVRPGLVTFIGRLEPQKGVDLLIDAVRQVPGATLRVIGDGSLRAQLEDMESARDVEFTGTVPNEQLPALLAETAVFVLPSHFEGTPKALLEAMASGIAVVATRVPGSDGVVVDGKTGLVAEPNPRALAEAISSILSNSELRTRLGAAARRYVEVRHSMLAAADQEADLIRSVLIERQVQTGVLSEQPQITESSKPEDAFTRKNHDTNTAA